MNTGVNSKTVHQKIKEVTGEKAAAKKQGACDQKIEIFRGKRRTSSRGGQNTSQSSTMMTEAHHLSSIQNS